MPDSSNKLSLTSELRDSYLFAGMNAGQLRRVVESSSVLTLVNGEQLFTRNDPARHFFQVRSGQFKLFRLSKTGIEKIVHIFSSGDTFAEAIMFMEHHAYPLTAVALTKSEVIAFENEVFMEILRESVDTCFRVMSDMSMRLKMRLDDIDALSLQNASLRFVSYLLQQLPEDSKEPSNVRLTLPKSVVASRLSIQPESFSRILHNLIKLGLINVDGPDIRINDLQGLRSFNG
ncbi:MAG TPA: Crp/Fnr family transcriptional regulator [Acidiferrobacteraceae bacterium]|nr:Crp/Fnr family transcriptional regulator [Acidiferrobacteraceae bacterium]